MLLWETGLQHAELISRSCLSNLATKAVILSLVFLNLSFILYLINIKVLLPLILANERTVCWNWTKFFTLLQKAVGLCQKVLSSILLLWSLHPSRREYFFSFYFSIGLFCINSQSVFTNSARVFISPNITYILSLA